MADALARGLAAAGSVRGLAVVTTDLVEEARRRHGTLPTATAALGRALTAGLLLGATLKRDERLSLEFNGDGPLGRILVDATAEGTQSGEIGSDVAHYLHESEQVPSAVGVGVFVEPDGRVAAAGGYLVQALPGAAPGALDRIAARVEAAPAPSELVRSGLDARGMLGALLGGAALEILEERPVTFTCRCSYERITTAILALGRAEIESLLVTERRAEAVCEFCATRYVVEEPALRALLDPA